MPKFTVNVQTILLSESIMNYEVEANSQQEAQEQAVQEAELAAYQSDPLARRVHRVLSVSSASQESTDLNEIIDFILSGSNESFEDECCSEDCDELCRDLYDPPDDDDEEDTYSPRRNGSSFTQESVFLENPSASRVSSTLVTPSSANLPENPSYIPRGGVSVV